MKLSPDGYLDVFSRSVFQWFLLFLVLIFALNWNNKNCEVMFGFASTGFPFIFSANFNQISRKSAKCEDLELNSWFSSLMALTCCRRRRKNFRFPASEICLLCTNWKKGHKSRWRHLHTNSGGSKEGSTSNVDVNIVPLLFGAEDSLKCCFPSC